MFGNVVASQKHHKKCHLLTQSPVDFLVKLNFLWYTDLQIKKRTSHMAKSKSAKSKSSSATIDLNSRFGMQLVNFGDISLLQIIAKSLQDLSS